MERTNPASVLVALIIIAVVAVTVYFVVRKREKFGFGYSESRPPPNGVDMPYRTGKHSEYELVASSGQLPDVYTSRMPDVASLLPKVGESTTLYDKDITDPNTYIHRPAPVVVLQGRQFATSDKLRGDIYITPNQPSPWAQTSSTYGMTDGYNDTAYFSETGQRKYSALTQGRQVNVVNEETIVN